MGRLEEWLKVYGIKVKGGKNMLTEFEGQRKKEGSKNKQEMIKETLKGPVR